MDKIQVRKEIENLIKNIKEHFDDVLNQDHIPQLELETVVKKIEKLHQKAIIFHYLNEHHPGTQLTAPLIANQDPSSESESASGSASASSASLSPIPATASGSSPASNSAADPLCLSSDHKSHSGENTQTDLFGNTPAHKHPVKHSHKTEDIRTHIGINDKFQFIAELFEGNENEYSAAINQLNNYPSYAEAEAYLNSIREIYKWKEDNVFADKFIKIVRKKLK